MAGLRGVACGGFLCGGVSCVVMCVMHRICYVLIMQCAVVALGLVNTEHLAVG